MTFPMDPTELFLFFARFFIGSSVLLGGVWLLEKFNILRNRDLTDVAWKTAVIASFMLLLPISSNFATKIELNAQTSRYIDVFVAQTSPELSNESAAVKVMRDMATSQMKPSQAASVDSTNALDNSTLGNSTLGNPTISNAKPPSQNNWQIPSFLVIPGLIAGFALLALILTYATAVRSLGARKRVSSDHQAFRLLYNICDKADIKATPYLTTTKRIDSPLCLPTGEICLPQWALDGLPDLELRGLIAHEVAHLKHHDPIILLILHALTRLFFLQPLFAVAQKRLADLAEFAADEWAAGHSDNPKSVAQAIYTCAKQITNKQQPQWGLAMARDKSKLRARVDRLLDANETQFKTTASWAKGAVVATLIASALGIPALALNDGNDKNAKVSKLDDGDTSISVRSNGQGEQTRSTYQQIKNGHEIKVVRDGLMALSTNGNSVGMVSPGGYLTLSETGNEIDRSIKFTMDDGKLVHTFERDGDEQSMTADDKQWLDTMMLDYLRNSGANANERVAKINKLGAMDAVIDEMEQIHSRGLLYYSAAAAKTGELSDSQIQRMVKILKSLTSDYDMRIAFTPLFMLENLSDETVKQIMTAVKSIGSDYEMRILLTSLLEARSLNDESVFATFLDLSDSIQSDYEMRVLLMGAVKVQPNNTNNAKQMLSLAKKRIKSDYELRMLISGVVKLFKDSPDGVDVAIESLKSLESDYEFRVAAMAIMNNVDLEHDAWLKLINSIDKVGSDYEATEILIRILSNMPDNNDLLEAVVKAAKKGVGSKHEMSRFELALATTSHR